MSSSNYPIIKHNEVKKQLAPQRTLNTREVLFVDQGIEEHQILIDSVRSEVAVHLLDSRYDGVSQLLEILQHYTNLDAVHIVSHGNAGYLILGNSTLSNLTLNRYQHDLFAIQNSLNQNADILLYGCNAGKGISGQYLIQQLAVLTGANVSASSHPVGNPECGGDWTLDVITSAITAECVFRQEAIKQFRSTLVTNTLDFTNDTVALSVTATHPTVNFGTINLKIVSDVNSTGTTNAALTLASTGSVDDSFDDFYYALGTNGEYLVIYTDGREVDFQSIKFGSGNGSSYTSLTVYAYRDNALLGSQTFSPIGANYPNNTSDTETVTFTDAIFDNADEIRLIGVDGVNQDVVNALIDDIVIADTVAAGPTITSATYDANTNTLVVTGTNMTATGGAVNDINVSKLTLTGQSGATYTLTSSNVEIDSATQFTVALNATDRVNIESLLNKNGATAVDSTTYNIAVAADWNPAQVGNADLTGNGITVSNVQSPTVTSATYDAATGNLVVTGTNLVAATGATNDITANKFTFTGEGGETYTLTDTSNVEISSETEFTITLSATDKAAINQIINKDGTSSTSGTTYNLAAVDDWNTVIGNTDISDAINAITVSNVAVPTITSATYDFATNTLTATGTGFLKNTGATNDIDISKFTFTGEGGATYTLTSTSDVEITSATSFSVSLSGTDLVNVETLLNNNGTTSTTSGTTYNLAAAEDWAAGADAAVNVADAINGITVSNYAVPTITSTTYDANTGQLVLAGTGFVSLSGAANDIDVSLFTFTGEGGSTYTLTDTSDAEVTSDTAATIVLSATDRLNINGILNNNGTTSALSGTTYNLTAAEDWLTGAPAANVIADAINAITVSNVPAPTITSATYDASAGSLIVTGTNLVKATGVNNDITVNKLTFTGEGGATYTLTDSSNVEITSDSSFTVTLSATDKAAINQIVNKNGTSSTSGTTYNLAAVDDWNTVIGNTDISDATNAITVSNVAVPTITSATYDFASNTLTVTGTGFLKNTGATNDIDISKFTFTGEGGATYTLTSTSDVEITSANSFSVSLSGTDLVNVETLLNNNGTTSATSGTTYNLAAAEDWAAGADAAVNVADAINGITVSNYAVPTITSTTYDASTGQLVLAGTGFVSLSGAANDIDVSLFTFTGEGGSTYTLTDTSDAEVTSDTAATIVLSATDRLNINGILNNNGTTSALSGTTYNLTAAEDWLTGAPAANVIADAINAITVSNVPAPTITSATYDASAGSLIVTGTNLVKATGVNNDITVNKLTFTGEGGATYTLTDSSNVEITSDSSFTVTLSATDKAAINQIVNKNGTSSTSGTTYNLAAVDDWNTVIGNTDISDATNAITVSNVAVPTITSSTYDTGTGVLAVTGTGLLKLAGANNDIDASLFTVTGLAGGAYTLTDTADVDITSTTQFTLTLSATDKAGVNALLDINGVAASDTTTYNLAAAEDWATGADAAVNVVDATGNGITVGGPVSTITSAAYDANTGVLIVTGTDFVSTIGAANDVIANKFTFTGEGGATYTLTDTANVDITSATAFTLTLSATDKTAINQIVNKDGASSTDGSIYNLAATEDWAAGENAAVNVADLIANPITVSNVAAPTITAATYNTGTGTLAVTGVNLLKAGGAGNDIIANKFTLTGEGGVTYTLTDTANVDITSATTFTLTLSAVDKAAVNLLVNKNGTASNDATTYNLAAAEDWAAGADAAVNVVDATGNAITATVAPPNGGGGGGGGGSNGSNNTSGSNGNNGGNDDNTTTPDTTAPGTKTFDGVTIDTQTETDGTTTLAIPVVDSTRIDDPNTVSKTHADIPVLTNLSGGAILTVSLPTGVGLSANGQSAPMNAQDAANDLVERITQRTTTDNGTLLEITAQGQRFLSSLASDEQVSVQTILPTVGSDAPPDLPLIISGSNLADDGKLVLVVDMSNMPPGSAIQLDNVAFAAIIGAVRVTGGAGENFAVGDDQDQFIVLGPDDDILFGGGGNDTVGSLGGNDQTNGDAGNDTVYGGAGHDVLTGGSGNDILNGGLGFDTAKQAGKLSDYQIAVNGNRIILNRDDDETDTLTDVELIRFETGPSLAIAYSVAEAVAHHLVKTWLGRDLTATEGNAVQNWVGATSDDIVTAFLNLPEAAEFNNQSTDELLAGLNENPNVIQVNTARTIVGSNQNDQGYLTQGLGFLVDGGSGHDVLRMRGSRDDVYLEQVDSTVEITRLNDGAMLSLTNAEMIAFDSGENQLLAHNRMEGILGRLVQTFFDRDATIDEWQMGRDALNHGVSPDVILNWFQTHANSSTLNDTDYIQTLYNQTYGRFATETELNQQLLRLDNGEVTREWLAVDIASSDEAITTIGSVWVVDSSV